MAKKPTYEELEQRVKELEKEIKKREDATMRKDTTLHRKACLYPILYNPQSDSV